MPPGDLLAKRRLVSATNARDSGDKGGEGKEGSQPLETREPWLALLGSLMWPELAAGEAEAEVVRTETINP